MSSKIVQQFLALVCKVGSGKTARSENDLSSKLGQVLESLGLHTVVDSSVTDAGRKRPDILAYVSKRNADLVLPAEVVVESKKPQELAGFPDLKTAMVSSPVWEEKTKAYLKANLWTAQYFVVTTFTSFAVASITPEVRKELASVLRSPGNEDRLKQLIQESTIEFGLLGNDSAPQGPAAWVSWTQQHFQPEALQNLRLSTIHNIVDIRNRTDFQTFANRLADFAAGVSEDNVVSSGLFESVRSKLPTTYAALDANTKRDLHLFLMAQHPGMDLPNIEILAKQHSSDALDEFVAASIHSLISRLFAFKAIEDSFCIDEPDPLVEPQYWIFSTARYDDKDATELMRLVFSSLRSIRHSSAMAIQKFAVYGFFFDWIEDYLDPIVFRSLFQILQAHNFADAEGDLLGRFFEMYAQKVNRSKRKSLGQYYTPLPIVEFIWKLALDIARARGELANLNVLDPASGSATFLAQGARLLFQEGIPQFWERLHGFDISAQVSGIAYVNLYIAILSNLDRVTAGEVSDLSLFVTDALDPRNGQYLKQILPLIMEQDYKLYLEQRIRLSAELKQPGTFNLVIGNPPYRNNSQRTLRQVSETFPRLLTSSVANARAQERNPRDDYAWFFGAADYYVGASGLIAFIVSDSFAQNLSYRYFRQDLLKLYHIRHLIRLGEHVFEDVGPRISFSIIVLEKRSTPLDELDDSATVSYADLRSLVAETPITELGSEADPRFTLLRSVAAGEQELPNPILHRPAERHNFSLYPTPSLIDRFGNDAVPIYARSSEGLFVDKWPGVITAFDNLFKSDSRDNLMTRFQSLFELSLTPGISERQMIKNVEKWGGDEGFVQKELERLGGIARQIRQKSLSFQTCKIRRTLDGAMPNSVRWYPPRSNEVYVYYEPELDIPRNEHEGKQTGWGTMQQWRAPESHLITPKLIYTTASKPQYGLKAFVVQDEWLVKIHGGTSQQYNYTGIANPQVSQRTDGMPNNLTSAGRTLYAALNGNGSAEQSICFYIAGIYNSAISTEFMNSSGSGIAFKIKIPCKKREKRVASEIASCGRSLRDLAWLEYLMDCQEPIPVTEIEKCFSAEFLRSLPLQTIAAVGRRFKSTERYAWTAETTSAVKLTRAELQEHLDDLVEDLYS